MIVRLQADAMRIDVAAGLARRFQHDYPERVGVRDCVVYAANGLAFVVYRTPGRCIVVREDHEIAPVDDDRPTR